MARIQFPHMSSALTASFSVRQPPNELFVLSCPSAAPHLPCGCRRRCKGFPSASSWPWPSGDRSALSVSRTSLPSQSPSLWQAPSLCRPTACSSSMAVSDLLSRRRISGSVCAVQLFHQFRAAQSRVHLQEHQGNFPFRSEERPASQLRPHAFPYQTEVLCHLAERKQFRILPNSLFSKVE